MEVVLLERVEKLGQMGDVVTVKPGFARNFLLPQNKALRANKANLAYFESQRVQLEAVNLERRKEAEAVAAQVDGREIVMVRQAGESGQLYGSVSARDIADSARETGFMVGRSQVDLNQPIKELGRYNIRIILHPEVDATILINVARSAEDAEAQKIASEQAAEADLLAETDDVQAELEEIEAEAADAVEEDDSKAS
ncbi:50S ribosomal protein L9 [Alphaproteobacteria bacterium HT1-32]|nr:50S ribosomal protein L9 [Alphaproteobacteria bacterium HT1-32]